MKLELRCMFCLINIDYSTHCKWDIGSTAEFKCLNNSHQLVLNE